MHCAVVLLESRLCAGLHISTVRSVLSLRAHLDNHHPFFHSEAQQSRGNGVHIDCMLSTRRLAAHTVS
jgi:hypothetical protein